MATRNRLYKLHYLLRKKGNEVNVKDRTVYRRAKKHCNVYNLGKQK